MGDAGGVRRHVASICAIPLVKNLTFGGGEMVVRQNPDEVSVLPGRGLFFINNMSLEFGRPF